MEISWIRHDKLASTNLQLAAMLKQRDLQEGTVVVADYQEAGKGQGSKSWQSQKDKNLLMSWLLFPAFLSASKQFQLSRLVSVSIVEVLVSMGLDPVIKWPNDILSGGGKIAGILIEHTISGGNIAHSIAGIGLNLNQTDFPDFPYPASSFSLLTGRQARVTEVAEDLVDRMSFRYQELKAGREAELEQAYLQGLFRLEECSLFEAEGQVFEGIIKGVNAYGELLVERNGTLSAYCHGEIALLASY